LNCLGQIAYIQYNNILKLGVKGIIGLHLYREESLVVAKPIDLILTLENEDAKTFWENMENPPEPTIEELQFCKDGIKLFNEHPFIKV